MELKRLLTPTDPMFPSAMELYRSCFPAHELREAASQRAVLSHPEYRFGLLYDGPLFVGLLLYWETAGFLYVEHFCIDPALRGKNYGTRALELLRRGGKPVVLEIDPLTDRQSIRRKAFYERAGFVENPYPHVHPPYTAGVQGHKLIVMSCPCVLSAAEYAAFADYLSNVVMA